jgi:hypothetical protein
LTYYLSYIDEGHVFDEDPVFDEEPNNVIMPLSCLTKCLSLITNVMEFAAVCTIFEENIVDVVSDVVASLAGEVVSDGNIEAATYFSIKRPRFGSSVLALIVISGILHVPMAWPAYTQVVINIQSPSTLNQTSMINNSLDGHVAFTKGNFLVSISRFITYSYPCWEIWGQLDSSTLSLLQHLEVFFFVPAQP